CPESGLLRRGRTRVEPHVVGLRRWHRAAGPAVHAGSDDRGEEPAVESCILGLHGPHATLHVLQHIPSVTPEPALVLAKMRHTSGTPRCCRKLASHGAPPAGGLFAMTTTKAELFRSLHAGPAPLVLANAWDVASARIIEDAGARAIATTSAGVSWSLGAPDGDHLGRGQAVDLIARITAAAEVRGT